jgi:hypothetical protein
MSVLDRIKFFAVSSGTGSFVVSSAVTGFRTPAGAGIPSGLPLSYIAVNPNDLGQWEYGHSAYTSSGTLIARSAIESSVGLGSAVNFSSPPVVTVGLLAEDLPALNLAAFGAVGDGTTDDTTAVQAALNSGLPLTFSKTYRVTSTLTISTSGQRIYGVNGGKISSTVTATPAISFSGGDTVTYSDNLIEGLGVECTGTGGDQNGYALIHVDGPNINRLIIRGCRLSSTTNGLDGIYLKCHNDTQHTTVKNVWITNNIFDTIGRMGVELLNQSDTAVARYSNIHITDNVFSSTGAVVSSAGQGISFSGFGTNLVVTGNTFTTCAPCVEVAGYSAGVKIDHNVFGGTGGILAFNNTNNTDFSFCDNQTQGVMTIGATGGILINNATNGVISGNNLNMTSASNAYVDLVNCSYVKIHGNNIKTDCVIGLQLDTCTNCIVTNNTLNAAAATSAFSVMRCTGSGCTNNMLRWNNIYQGSGGSAFDQVSGATLNMMTDNILNATAGVNPVVTKVGSILTFTITFNSYSSWCPNSVLVIGETNATGGGSEGAFYSVIGVRSFAGATAVESNINNLITPVNMTIARTYGTDTMTITCTPTSGNNTVAQVSVIGYNQGAVIA